MALEVLASRAVKVSPRGNLSGIFSVQGFTLVVLPKQWRDGRKIIAAPTRGTVTCHELDTLVFDAPPGEVGEVVDGLLRLNRSEAEELDASRIVEEIALPTVKPEPVEAGTGEQALDALLNLLELSLRVTRRWSPVPVLRSYGAGGQSLDDPAATARLALVLQEVLRAWHLVRQIQDRMRDLRRTYTATQERVRVVRGRIQTRNLFRTEISGEVDCEFEEFSEISPLYRVVRTGLDLVVSNSSRWGWLAGLPLARQVLDGAYGIRAQFQHISSMPRVEAARAASQMRLGRPLRRWEPVRALCASILADSPATHGEGAAGTDTSSAFVVNTAALWQALIDHALYELPRERVQHERPGGVDLWTGAPFRSKNVDSSLTFRGQRWLLDAKYKDFPGDSAPSMEDQYQMFGYSHLYGDVAHVAMIYPRPAWARKQSVSGPYPRGGLAGPCTLRLTTAPFPAQYSVGDSQDHWEHTVGGIQAALLEMLDDQGDW